MVLVLFGLVGGFLKQFSDNIYRNEVIPVAELTEIYTALLAAYGKQHWWPAKSDFEMMAGAILTQNTTWKNVEKSIAGFGGDVTPEAVLALTDTELARRIRPSGYYNQKAVRLKALARWYIQNGGAEALRKLDKAELRPMLLELKGVGRETADSILVYSLGKTSFVVDAYTRRILSRLGYNLPDDYDDIRELIEKSIPDDLYIYNEFHALIVNHAKQHCTKKPICKNCPLGKFCTYHEEKTMIRTGIIESKDLNALEKLYFQLMEEECDAEALKKVFEKLCADSAYRLIGAWNDEGRLVGTVMLVICYDLTTDCRPFAVAENVVVDQNCRGEGVGKAIMAKAEELAREQSCRFIMLASSDFRKDAHRFYRSLGYGEPKVQGFRKLL